MSEYINLFDIPEIKEKVKTQESLNESLESKNRIIWDDCTPTSDRRPTTKEDIDNDIHVEDFDSAEELYETLLSLSGYDEEDFYESDTIFDRINDMLTSLEDPGDGSPNIIYCKVNGEVMQDCWYEDCKELDMNTCSEEDIKEVLKQQVEENDKETREILRQAGIDIDDVLPHLIPYDDEDDE